MAIQSLIQLASRQPSKTMGNGIGSKLPAPNPTHSYWLTQPHHLASYRSSETPPDEVDIAIIGTGLAGTSVAYHILTQSEHGSEPKIALFEARQACSGATGRNGGHVKVQIPSLKRFAEKHDPAAAQELFSWVSSQRIAIKTIAEQEGIDCDLLVTRSFDAYYDAVQALEVKAFLEEQRQMGATWTQDVQWFEGPSLERMTGIKGLAAAASLPALSLWPYKFVTALLERAVEMGAFLYTETPIESVETGSDDNVVLKTARGTTKAKKVIYATNGYTSALLPQYEGVIVPVKGQNSILVPLARAHNAPLTNTCNLFHTPQAVDYLVPRPDGNVILGGSTAAYRKDGEDRNPDWFDTVDDTTLINDSVKTHFDRTMAMCFRGWEDAEAKAAMTWTGIMGNTPDGAPHAGLVPGTKNQYVLAGFNGGGMALIFTATQELSRMVLQGVKFEDTGIPSFFKTTEERLQSKFN